MECETLGGFLPEPKTQQEDILLKGLATVNGFQRMWFGAEDLLQEGKYFWAFSGGALDGGYHGKYTYTHLQNLGRYRSTSDPPENFI